jgi:hypothetical protein
MCCRRCDLLQFPGCFVLLHIIKNFCGRNRRTPATAPTRPDELTVHTAARRHARRSHTRSNSPSPQHSPSLARPPPSPLTPHLGPRAHAADMIKEVKTTMHQVRAVLKLPCTKSTVVPKSQRVHCGPSLVPVHVFSYDFDTYSTRTFITDSAPTTRVFFFLLCARSCSKTGLGPACLSRHDVCGWVAETCCSILTVQYMSQQVRPLVSSSLLQRTRGNGARANLGHTRR